MKYFKKIEKHLPVFLKNARWWLSGVKEYSVKDYLETDIGFLLFLETRKHVFQLPMVKIEKPCENILQQHRYIKINNEYFVEAEYTPYYFDLMDELGISFEEYGMPLEKIVSSKPLTLESTNAVGIHTLSNNSVVVIKGYRMLSKINLEPLMYKELSKKKFKNIPRLYRIYHYKLDHNYYLSMIIEYVHGEKDAGAPFYQASLHYLYTFKKGIENRKKAEDKQFQTIRLTWRIARIIADMHIKLNPGLSKEFVGLEEITSQDIKAWERRIDDRVEYIRETLDYLIQESKGKEKKYYEFWLVKFNESEKTIMEAKNILAERFIGTYKGRIHQDLHLQQMIYVPGTDDFIIIDFEGEPGRSDEEKLSKEPLIRDLATMVQSYHYIAFSALKDICKIKKDSLATFSKLGKAFLAKKSSKVFDLILQYTVNLAYIYAHTTSEKIIGRDLFNYRQALKTAYPIYMAPWVIERALYEIIYELKYRDQRPGWFIIPLIAVINPVLPLVK